MTKIQDKNIYLENEKSFWGEIKSIFHISKGLSHAKNCLRPESASSTDWENEDCSSKLDPEVVVVKAQDSNKDKTNTCSISIPNSIGLS